MEKTEEGKEVKDKSSSLAVKRGVGYPDQTRLDINQELEVRMVDMSFLKKTIVTLTMLLLVFSFVGCEKEGPAERAGKKIDKTIEDAKKAVKE